MDITKKSFCDFTKSESDKFSKEIKKLVKKPKYICKKCLRASSDQAFLCKPKKI